MYILLKYIKILVKMIFMDYNKLFGYVYNFELQKIAKIIFHNKRFIMIPVKVLTKSHKLAQKALLYYYMILIIT